MDPAEIVAAEQLTLFLFQQGTALFQKIQESRATGVPLTEADIDTVHASYVDNKAKLDALLASAPKSPGAA